MSDVIGGSCLCGAVRFEVSDVTPMQYCHARRCQKATGSAFAPEMLAPAESLRWLSGAEQVREYEAPLLERPPAYRRAFCDTCGSPLPAAIGNGQFVALNAGVLDDDPGSRPFRHAFVDQKACWHEIVDDLPSYPGQPPVPEEYQG